MDTIRAAFGKKKDFYQILGVAKDASSSDIRKAYFKLARLCHPDKCPDDPDAKSKFQALSLVHATLSDEEKRKVYDETGALVDDDVADQSEKEWYDYWRNLFPRVTKEQILAFQDEYQGSEEEKGDVLKAYTESKGDMARIIDSVMLATDEDEDRFRAIIESAIEAEEVERFKGFGKKSVKADKKRKAKAEKEAKEAEELLKMLQEKRGNTALARMKEHREKEFGSFIDAIESKYGGGKAKKQKKAKASHEEVTDEEFEKIQKELTKGAKKGKKASA